MNKKLLTIFALIFALIAWYYHRITYPLSEAHALEVQAKLEAFRYPCRGDMSHQEHAVLIEMIEQTLEPMRLTVQAFGLEARFDHRGDCEEQPALFECVECFRLAGDKAFEETGTRCIRCNNSKGDL